MEERALRPTAPDNDNSHLHLALEKLPKETRVPLIMYYLDGQNVDTVAQNLNISKANVYTRLRRATRQLHELLAEQGGRS